MLRNESIYHILVIPTDTLLLGPRILIYWKWILISITLTGKNDLIGKISDNGRNFSFSILSIALNPEKIKVMISHKYGKQIQESILQ